MILGEINFPKPLVAAARKRKLVVFAGAGVSMGKPAGLPDFMGLAKKIGEQAGERELDIEKALIDDRPDVYLGRLEDRGVNVHALAAEILLQLNARPTELHRVLLSLYSGPDSVCVVTTNFDRLFEQAMGAAFPEAVSAVPEYRYPELPARRNFHGIVHPHGDVVQPADMVLTDKDFGTAYLGHDPRAQRFALDLLSANTLLFVGYSGDDRPYDLTCS